VGLKSRRQTLLFWCWVHWSDIGYREVLPGKVRGMKVPFMGRGGGKRPVSGWGKGGTCSHPQRHANLGLGRRGLLLIWNSAEKNNARYDTSSSIAPKHCVLGGEGQDQSDLGLSSYKEHGGFTRVTKGKGGMGTNEKGSGERGRPLSLRSEGTRVRGEGVGGGRVAGSVGGEKSRGVRVDAAWRRHLNKTIGRKKPNRESLLNPPEKQKPPSRGRCGRTAGSASKM